MLQLAFVNFKQNSYILVEGTETTDYFFIIQNGKVRCYNEVQLPGTAPAILGPGDFVGVIPCMTGQVQNQNVVAITPVVAIMVKRSQYPDLIMNNTPVAMKIVRSFARDMRVLNDQLTKLTLNKTAASTPEQLFSIAEFFQVSGHNDIATYAYYQYLKECPSGMNIQIAKQRFVQLKPKSKASYFESTPDTIRSYSRDTMIFSECQQGADMFIIQSGSVRISRVVGKDEVILAILHKGDMFGEMALLEKKPRSACAIAHEDCTLMVVNNTNFNQMVTTQPQMISKLTTMFADRIWAMQRQLANTQLKEMRDRLIDMISLQIEKQKIVQARGEVYHTGLTAMDIINLCGIPGRDQREAMSQLQADQTIRLNGAKIDVPDISQLIKQAAFYRKQNAKHSK